MLYSSVMAFVATRNTLIDHAIITRTGDIHIHFKA